MMSRLRYVPATLLCAILALCTLQAQTAPKITPPKEALGFNIGDDYQVANYTELEAYWKKLASESNRMKLVSIGKTEEGRDQWMAIFSSPENMKNLEHYRDISARLAHAEGLTDEQAHALAKEGKTVVWIDGSLHASESVGSQQLMEWVYQLASRNDEETLRLLRDTIILCVQANPDGQELIANWYMRHSVRPDAPLVPPEQRSMGGMPTQYNKYIGHDDNRDFYMSNMKETTNMNRVMFQEWFPQIVYNHHQTGPAGAVIFMPPFRDPFNYNFDPLVPLGIELVGTAMHSRLVAEGKGGSAMRSGSNYSTWWNGGLRTITYFHNMIGILTEIIGEPTPMNIPVVADKQLPKGDWPLPVTPGPWHYRQSIEYEMSNNRAICDIASRYRETFLYNFYRMGMNSIERGSRDNWTITPKRIAALEAAAAAASGQNQAAEAAAGGGRGGRGGGGRGGRGAAAQTAAAPAGGDLAPGGDVPPGFGGGGRGGRGIPMDLYNSVLHDPKLRDPREYIIPSDQPDFATATEFVNALWKNGITILHPTAAFTANGKNYPAGSYVIKTAQSFRPHIMDMFEPQDHPNDFAYPGGPPNRPYDITGWTLAMQMGVQFDRILDGFDTPAAQFPKVTGLLPPPPATVSGPSNPAGYLVSHQINNSFIVTNRLLKANCDVYWLKNEQPGMGTGAIWVPASAQARAVLEKSAKDLGVPAVGLAQKPAGDALKLKPIRIGLYDAYGSSMNTGWTRWLFEQYEMPFETVYPQSLDAGNLKSRFDVLVFTAGTIRGAGGFGGGRGGGGGGGGRGGRGGNVPDEYRDRTGSVTEATTLPQLKKFVELGGTIITIGSSTSVASWFGLPVSNYLVEMGADGRERNLPADKFYIPGSLLRMNVDNTNPLAYGMPKQVDIFFDNSPVFKLGPTVELQKTSPVGWFGGSQVLDSGWAWGQQYLDGGTAVAEANVGEGKVVLLGPEVNFRDQPHGTYKLLFNGLYMGSTTTAPLP
ncbi:MAG TPA: M14 metallopeptidase family protein [Verrucomicrobiae bacterium]|nr:M14 metallopeptidase family protein [Verrucomicrobiae bacterium]